MKLVDIAKGYQALAELSREALPIKASYRVAKMMNRMERPFFFYAEKEGELLREYKPDEQDGMQVRFSDPERSRRFNEKHEELDAIEEEIRIQEIELDVDTGARIRPEALREMMRLGLVKVTGLEDDEAEESEETDDGQRRAEDCACGRH